jgi:hypothetical protein
MAKLIDPFFGVDRAWMSGIGRSFPPHKYADVKRRLPRVARPVTPFYRKQVRLDAVLPLAPRPFSSSRKPKGLTSCQLSE